MKVESNSAAQAPPISSTKEEHIVPAAHLNNFIGDLDIS